MSNKVCPHWDQVWNNHPSLDELSKAHRDGRFPRLEKWQRAEPDRHNAGPCPCGNPDKWACYWQYQRAHVFGQARAARPTRCKYYPDNDIDRMIQFLVQHYGTDEDKGVRISPLGTAIAEEVFMRDLQNKEATWSWLKKAALEHREAMKSPVETPYYLGASDGFDMEIVREVNDNDGETITCLDTVIYQDGLRDPEEDSLSDVSWESLRKTLDD